VLDQIQDVVGDRKNKQEGNEPQDFYLRLSRGGGDKKRRTPARSIQISSGFRWIARKRERSIKEKEGEDPPSLIIFITEVRGERGKESVFEFTRRSVRPTKRVAFTKKGKRGGSKHYC